MLGSAQIYWIERLSRGPFCPRCGARMFVRRDPEPPLQEPVVVLAAGDERFWWQCSVDPVAHPVVEDRLSHYPDASLGPVQ